MYKCFFVAIVTIIITIFALLVPKCTSAQSVSIGVGTSCKSSLVYSVEFKTSNVGFYVSKYNYDVSNRNIVDRNVFGIGGGSIVGYSGVMFGVNYHIKGMSNITLSGGVGSFNQYMGYKEKPNYGYYVNDNVAYEFSMGKEIINNDHFIMSIRGGVNSSTLIFGMVSMGVKL